MWKCPNCETVNDADVCVVCGEAKPIFSSNNQNANYVKEAPVPPARPYVPTEPKVPEKKKSNAWVYYVIAIVAVLCILAVAAVFIFMRSVDYNDEDYEEDVTEVVEEEYTEDEYEAAQKAEAEADAEADDEDEEMVVRIGAEWAQDAVIINGREYWNQEFERTVEYCKEFRLNMSINNVSEGDPYGVWHVYVRDNYGKWRKIYSFYYYEGEDEVETVVRAHGGAFPDFDAIALLRQSSGEASFSYGFECYDFVIDYSCDIVDFAEDEPSEHRYTTYLSDVTWEEANLYAKNQGGYLACINSEDEFEKICKMADAAGIRVLWIGAKKTGSSWYNTKWIDGTKMTYTKWLVNEPSNYDEYNNPENYLVILKRDGEWYFNDEINEIDEYSYISGSLGYVIEFDK